MRSTPVLVGGTSSIPAASFKLLTSIAVASKIRSESLPKRQDLGPLNHPEAEGWRRKASSRDGCWEWGLSKGGGEE